MTDSRASSSEDVDWRTHRFGRRFAKRCRQAGIGWQEGYWNSPDGFRTAYLRLTPVAKQRAGRGTVIFAHGAGTDLFYPHVSLFLALVDAGLTVFAFDLAGHGWNSSGHLTRSEMSQCIARACRQALELKLPEPFFVVGYSMGGVMAFLGLAQKSCGEIVKAAVIAAPSRRHSLVLAALSEVRLLWSGGFWRAVLTYGLPDIVPAVGPFRRGEYPVRFADDALAGSGNGIDSFLELICSSPFEESAQALAVPTLAIYGGWDRVAPPSDFVRMAGPQISRVCLPRETHASILFSKKLAQTVVAWLQAKD